MTKKNNTFSYLPLSIRVETVGGLATPLLLRGTPLPAKRKETYSTANDEQSSVDINLFIGERPIAKDNTPLGKFQVKGIPPAPKGKPQIAIEFSVDKTCRVTVKAIVDDEVKLESQVLKPSRALSKSFIENTLELADSMSEEDAAVVRNIEAVNRAKELIAKAEEKLKSGPNQKLSEAVAALGLALASEDSEDIRIKSDDLNTQLTTFFDFSNIFESYFRTPQANKSPVKESEPPKRKNPTPHKQDIMSTPTNRILGKIFGGGTFTLDPQLCFVLIPFAEKFTPIYEDHIKPTVEKSGLRCERADEIVGTGLITWDIWEKINRARFLIADLTDRNPNVFYELGLAHSLSKDVILLSQSMDFVPFDLKSLRCIEYEFTPRGTQQLEKAISATTEALMQHS
jgi:hypothetical protein